MRDFVFPDVTAASPGRRVTVKAPRVDVGKFLLLIAALVAMPMKTLGQQPQPQCDQTLWKRVYHPQRFQIIQRCTSITGTFVSFKTEPDGDLHIRMKVDPEFQSLLNAKNLSSQKGNLVVEPVCERPVTQSDVGHTCDGYKSALKIPKVGVRVRVTGPLVLDTMHGWIEIHAPTSIEVVKSEVQ